MTVTPPNPSLSSKFFRLLMTKIAKNAQPYETRQIVAKVGRVGEFVAKGKKYFIP